MQNVSEGEKGLKSYVIFPTWYSFDTKEKSQPLFKSCSTISEKAKMDLPVMWHPPFDVVFIQSRYSNHFLSPFEYTKFDLKVT